MTVPPLFGWEVILTVVALLVAVAVVFLLVLAAGLADNDRSDWQAYLEARSSRSTDPATGPADRSAGVAPAAPDDRRSRSSA
jgi:hypothetical protein